MLSSLGITGELIRGKASYPGSGVARESLFSLSCRACPASAINGKVSETEANEVSRGFWHNIPPSRKGGHRGMVRYLRARLVGIESALVR